MTCWFRKRPIVTLLQEDLDDAQRALITSRFQFLYWQAEVARQERKVGFIQKEIVKWKREDSTIPSMNKPLK